MQSSRPVSDQRYQRAVRELNKFIRENSIEEIRLYRSHYCSTGDIEYQKYELLYKTYMRLKMVVQQYEQRVNDSNVGCDNCHRKRYTITSNSGEDLYYKLSFQRHKGNQLHTRQAFSHLQ